VNLVAQPPCCQDGYGMLCKFCSCPDRTARIIIHQGDLLRSRWWASHPASLYKHQEAPRIPAFVVLGTKTCRLLAIQVEQLDTSSNIAPLSYVISGTVSTSILPKEPPFLFHAATNSMFVCSMSCTIQSILPHSHFAICRKVSWPLPGASSYLFV
jgi:hypothetical protein